jgi:hypothetical protein
MGGANSAVITIDSGTVVTKCPSRLKPRLPR